MIGAGLRRPRGRPRPQGRPVEVTLVDQHNFHTFQPLLYQVATAGLSPTDVAHVVRGLFHRQPERPLPAGSVTGVDWAARTWRSTASPTSPSTTSCSPPAHASPGSAPRCRRARLPALHARGRHPPPQPRAPPLRGGRPRPGGARPWGAHLRGGRWGPTGRRDGRALAELFAMVFRKDYPWLDVGRAPVSCWSRCRTTSCTRSRRRAAAMPSRPCARAASRCGSAPRSPPSAADAVTFADGEVLPCQTLVWAAGVQAEPAGQRASTCPGRGGRHPSSPTCACPGRPGVWAIGDVAAAATAAATCCRSSPRWPCSPVATSPARSAACSTAAHPPFRYRDKGTMATIGRRAAVAELPGGIRLRGRLGLAGVAGPPPRHARGPAQPGVRPPQLGLELPHLGPRAPASSPVRSGAMTADAATIRSTVDAYCAAFTAGDADAYVGPVRRGGVDRGPGGHAHARGPRGDRRLLRPVQPWPTRSSCAAPVRCAWRRGGGLPDAGPPDHRRRHLCASTSST